MPELSIEAYYQLGLEEDRLERRASPLERARTQVVLSRKLPAPPSDIIDVGGGAGAYAFWLAGLGYTVHLVDPIQLHVDQASARVIGTGEGTLASIRVGDARRLQFTDAS